MKALFIFLLLALLACGRESSPEDRSIVRDERILQQIDSLILQNHILTNRIIAMDKRLKALERN